MSRLASAVLLIACLMTAASCSSGSTTQSQADNTTVAAPDMRDQRYCEVLLVSMVESKPIASVYNTYPLNKCPQELWSTLDAKTLAAEHGSTVALLNGPRHWMINHVEKVGDSTTEKNDYGVIEMYKHATVPTASFVDQARPYSPYPVSRSTIFTYSAGTEIFQLLDPDGSTYVMQSFSQQKDPSLSLSTLPSLANTLALPAGWKFESRVLADDLRIVTVKNPAEVLQDELGNSYSKIPANEEN